MVLFLWLLPTGSIAQSKWQASGSDVEAPQSRKVLRKARPVYISTGLGLNNVNLRDFATSPLIYQGPGLFAAVSRLKMDQRGESEFGLTYTFGMLQTKIGDHSQGSRLNSASLFYGKLYPLTRLNSEKWSFKAGGLLNATANIRMNQSLNNNAFGAEMVATAFGSFKVTRNVSRASAKTQKLLFLTFNLKPRVRHLSFRFNAGLLNNSLRNGYVYLDQALLINNNNAFRGHRFNAFSGLRFSSALDYTIWLNTENAIQFSYLWDAYKTGDEFDQYEMASHVLHMALLFNTKRGR